jgi:phage I-like protein
VTLKLDEGQTREQPSWRLQCAVLAASSGEPVNEFLLIPFGEVTVDRPIAGADFVFTPEHAESAKHWFDLIGRKLAIDYEHQSFDRLNSRDDGLRPAAGWIAGLEVRDDGLWATEVSWTERAGELLRSGEYRYFSPVIYWADEDYSDVAALGPVALTNDPAMRGVQALAASQRRDGELETAREEAALLRRKLALQEADGFVERGMRLGKIVDSNSMDWREDYMRDAEQAEQRLSRAPVLLPPGRVVKLDRRGAVSGKSEAQAAHDRHADLYRRWGIEVEDLAAYERASAAGRVRMFGS